MMIRPPRLDFDRARIAMHDDDWHRPAEPAPAPKPENFPDHVKISDKAKLPKALGPVQDPRSKFRIERSWKNKRYPTFGRV